MNVTPHTRRTRVVALLVGGFLLICSLAPYGFGWQAQTLVHALIDQLTQGWHAPITITRYQRGWFSSTAEILLALTPEIQEVWRTYAPPDIASYRTPTVVEITQRVWHGPFPFALHPDGSSAFVPVQALLSTTLRPGPWPQAPGRGAAEPPLMLHVNTTVLLNGASQSRLFIPALDLPAGTAADLPLTWNGLRGAVHIDQHGRHLQSALRAPGLHLKRPEAQVRLQNIIARLEAQSRRHQPFQGHLTLSVDTADILSEAAAQAAWALQSSELRTALSLTGETIHTDVDLQCATCRFANVPYTQGTAHLQIRRLHLPTCLALGQAVLALWPDEPDLESLWFRLLFSGDVARFLAGLAQTSPTFTLTQARAHAPEGTILLTLHTQLDGKKIVSPGSLPQLLQTIDAEATLEAPAAWVQEMAVTLAVHFIRERTTFGTFLSTRLLRTMAAMAVEKYLNRLIDETYLTQDGSTYKSTARYHGGQLWVNEKPVTLPSSLP